MRKIRIIRKGYRRKGIKVRGTSYLAEDRGKTGKTPISQRWFKPKRKLGWRKDLPQEQRIKLASRNRSDLSSGRALLALSNVSTDPETRRKAKQDAEIFFMRLKRK